jgi:hypothetical protein
MSLVPIKYSISSNNLTLYNFGLGFGSNKPQLNLSDYYANSSSNYIGIKSYSIGINTLPNIGSTISFSSFNNKQSLPNNITDFTYLNNASYNLSGTAYNTTSFAGWLSGDACSCNGTSDSYNNRTAYGSTRKVVMVSNQLLRARPGHTISINARMGQTSTFVGYSCQFWLNTTGSYVKMSQNLSISISNGSSSASTFVIPTSTPEGNYAFCITLAKVNIATLTAAYLASNYPFNVANITVDVYPLQVYI